MESNKGRLCLVLLVATLAMAIAPAAQADVLMRDGRDPGPLDIRKVTGEKAGDWYLRTTVTLGSKIRMKDFRKGFLVLDIDHSGDGRSDHWLYVTLNRGTFAVYSYDLHERSTYCCSGGVRRVGPRTLRIRFPQFSNYDWFQGGHLFRVGSFYEGPRCPGGCTDTAPDRDWLINDFTPPTISRFDVPIAAFAGGKPQATIKYRLSDQGFSGLKRHQIQVAEGEKWSELVTRRSGGKQTYTAGFEPGQTVSLRLGAVDRAGNLSYSGVRGVTAPIDDAATTTANFFGLWEAADTTDSYLGTLHRSRSPLDDLTYTAAGSHYCLLYSTGPSYGTALWEIGDWGFQVDMHSDSELPLQRTCLNFSPSRERSVRVSEYNGRINVDGFWTDDIYELSSSVYDDGQERRLVAGATSTQVVADRSSVGAWVREGQRITAATDSIRSGPVPPLLAR